MLGVGVGGSYSISDSAADFRPVVKPPATHRVRVARACCTSGSNFVCAGIARSTARTLAVAKPSKYVLTLGGEGSKMKRVNAT